MPLDDSELLERVCADKTLIRSVLLDEDLEDWTLPKSFGEFLARINPDDLTGHVILMRACRHLGDLEKATQELARCHAIIDAGGMIPVDQQTLVPMVEAEHQMLREGRRHRDQ